MVSAPPAARHQFSHLGDYVHQPRAQFIRIGDSQSSVTVADQAVRHGALQDVFDQEEIGGELH
ncbi:MAG TPA: hypothetical protein VKG02_18490, partial [Blastocatellia bacterium]|nr:hypothetical protein [Blastocatellia bacterium]